MDTLQALILGIVQGLAEYLPVSSSGHLELCRQLLGIDLDGAKSLEFDVALHVATVLSTIVILWREFVPLCRSFFTFRMDNDFRYVIKIFISCIPVAIVGFCFKDRVEEMFDGNLAVVGTCLIITAALLAFAYFTRTDKATEISPKGFKGREITFLDAFVIGCSQALAVLPGLSRSGTTIATGILIGDKKESVAKFSFFMVIIPILGEALLHIKDIVSPDPGAVAEPGAEISLTALAVGFLAAFIVGCIACKWMLEIVKKGKLIWFAAYCLVVGIIATIFAA